VNKTENHQKIVDIHSEMRYASRMVENSQTQPLYWEASYEIVLSLMEAYPEVNVENVGIEQLYQWIIALPAFADDPALANDHLLNDILREWYEETISYG